MTVTAPTLDNITGNTVMVKMRELIKQMTIFAKEVADLVNTIPEDIQDTYSREAIDDMIDDLDTAISTLSDSVYPKTEVYTKSETDDLISPKADASDVYEKSEVYTKTETDDLISPKADANSVYTKSETDTLLNAKANSNNVYNKSETDNLLNAKADSSDVYTKTETNTLLNDKANSNSVYTKSETDALLNAKQDELTAGTGISIVNNVISTISGASNVQIMDATVEAGSQNYIKLFPNLQNGDILVICGSASIGSGGYAFTTAYLFDENIAQIQRIPIPVYNNVTSIIGVVQISHSSSTKASMSIDTNESTKSFGTIIAKIIRSL